MPLPGLQEIREAMHGGRGALKSVLPSPLNQKHQSKQGGLLSLLITSFNLPVALGGRDGYNLTVQMRKPRH